MLGFVMALALRYPNAFRIARKVLPYIGAILLIVGMFTASFAWHRAKVEEARKAGFSAAELQYSKLVSQANEKTAAMSIDLRDMSLLISGRSAQRERELAEKIQDIKLRIQHEVSSDSRYVDCRVSDSVFNDIQSQRSAVNAGIAASNPGKP